MEKLKSVIGKIAEEKPEKLGEADVEKLQGIAEKLGIAPPKG